MFKVFKIIIPFLLLQLFYSCEKEEFNTSFDARLVFSEDTVSFDTIFTTIGSATRRFTVKNPYQKNLRINSIELAGGESSPYRLNIDGYPGYKLENVELRERDSLFIFVEVTIDPNNANLPMIVKDSIIFSFNGKQQDIDLIAYGQDVHLIKTKRGLTIINNDTSWMSDKPYLIYDSLLLAPNNTLTIEPGAHLYFHKNSRLYIAGTLYANGTYDSPIIFEGDRLESDYEDVPGQWDGIWLMPGSKDNLLDFTEIKNAIIGIQVDTLVNETHPTLTLSNSRIENMTYAGIYARGTTINAYNNLIGNCGQYAVILSIGGAYEFYHCTIANYWGYSTRTTPSVIVNNYYVDINNNIQIRDVTKALFGNCIIYGNKESEVAIDKDESGVLDFKFDHTLIKVDDDFSTANPDHFENVLVNKDPNFINPYEGEFELDTLSVAKDYGKEDYGILYPYDLNLNSRTSDNAPDLGAFERQESR